MDSSITQVSGSQGAGVVRVVTSPPEQAEAKPAETKPDVSKPLPMLSIDPVKLSEQIQEAVAKLNEQMKTMQRDLGFSYDERLNREIVTALRHSLIEDGLPGKLIISAPPLMPAVCRDKIAVGTTLSEVARISSPKPGIIFSQTCSVASGVTSRTAGPVPPVVTIRQHFSTSASSRNTLATSSTSSATSRATGCHWLARCLVKYS